MVRRTKVPAAPDQRYCGLIMLFDIRSCAPTALLPDGMIQRMRVGATSALGVKYLARPDARTVGLIGAGWQAGAQLLTVAEIRSIRRIKVFSPSPQRREAFATEIAQQLGLEVQPVSSAEAAASDVDILLSATNSRTPTITADMIRPGMHIGVISVEEIGEDALRKMQVLGVPQRLRLAANHWAIAEGSAAHIHERSFEHGWWRNEALWERFVELGDLIHDRGRGAGRRPIRRSSWPAGTAFSSRQSVPKSWRPRRRRGSAGPFRSTGSPSHTRPSGAGRLESSQAPYCLPRAFGSQTLRSSSLRRFRPSTQTMIARPGKITRWGYCCM